MGNKIQVTGKVKYVPDYQNYCVEIPFRFTNFSVEGGMIRNKRTCLRVTKLLEKIEQINFYTKRKPDIRRGDHIVAHLGDIFDTKFSNDITPVLNASKIEIHVTNGETAVYTSRKK